ncbi:MAG: GTP cyclohydrolase FolE2 [Pseudomonadota bacterium]
MTNRTAALTAMPDIAAREHLHPQGTLDWVGMSNVHVPLQVSDGGKTRTVAAKAQIYVDLADPQAKGIHMSRLYLMLDASAGANALTPAEMTKLLSDVLTSHEGLSSKAFLQFDFEYLLRRPALLSDNSGWNSYPVQLKGTFLNGELHLELGVTVQYSSTCPCSAALSRQIIQTQFENDFAGKALVSASDVKTWLGTEEAIAATPHSQRSDVHILTRLEHGITEFPISELIDRIEDTLQTAVQTAVKREDEQEFARRNAANLMFCEDAGRRVQKALNDDARFADFWVRVEHMESLHPHDAVSIVTKGVPDGYLPIP